MRDWKRLLLLTVSFAVGLAILSPALRAETTPETPPATAASRLHDTVGYLASDALEGRGVGTEGLNKAADYLAAQFAALGLNTSLYDGQPFQKFELITGAELGDTQRLALAPTADSAHPVELKFNTDFTPLALGGGGKFDLPVVFVGYGITAKDQEYDDYAGLHVDGKAVIVLRHEPQQANPHSAFNGTDDSPFATMMRKVSNAYEHGAAAVIFVTDDFAIKQAGQERIRRLQNNVAELRKSEEEFRGIQTPNENELEAFREQLGKLTSRIDELTKELSASDDTLLDFRHGGSPNSGREMPVLHATRAALDPMVSAATGKSLAALEAEIDAGEKPQPHSRELDGWRLQGETQVKRVKAPVKNVVAVLEGEGPHADETIVIGAHYDHLGFGGEGSFDPHSDAVHNGADDNASGTAALVEVARQLAARPEKLGRRVVFIAFTGEERGLHGSAHYVKEPLFPLEKTVAMLNMDMVGRLRDNKLIIQGVDTSPEFGPIIDGLNADYGFQITRQPGGDGPSDHASFYPREIPVMHFFTDLHDDYHRPSDDTEKVNFDGAAKIAEMVTRTAEAIAKLDTRPGYVAVASSAGPARDRSGSRPYFGSIPDFAQNQEGYALSGVTKGGPAEKAGLLAGDVIIRMGESKIGNLDDFDSALRKFKAGDKAPVTVRRGTEELTVEVELDKPR